MNNNIQKSIFSTIQLVFIILKSNVFRFTYYWSNMHHGIKIQSKQPHYKAYSKVGQVQTNDNCHLYRIIIGIIHSLLVGQFFLLLILQTRGTRKTTFSQNTGDNILYMSDAFLTFNSPDEEYNNNNLLTICISGTKYFL